MKKVFLMVLLVSLMVVFCTACQEKSNKDSSNLRKEIEEAKKSGDTELVEKLEEKLKNLGFWLQYKTYEADIRQPVDESDELQKIVYTFNPRGNVHTMTLDYEPLDDDEDAIPAYQQKCVCKIEDMPFELERGQSYRVNVTCEYVESNEYAGIANSCWLYSDEEKVKIVNNDGYSEGQVFAGEKKEGRHDNLNTSFTITMPELQEDIYNFDIKFKSDCGVTVYNYVWDDEYID